MGEPQSLRVFELRENVGLIPGAAMELESRDARHLDVHYRAPLTEPLPLDKTRSVPIRDPSFPPSSLRPSLTCHRSAIHQRTNPRTCSAFSAPGSVSAGRYSQRSCSNERPGAFEPLPPRSIDLSLILVIQTMSDICNTRRGNGDPGVTPLYGADG